MAPRSLVSPHPNTPTMYPAAAPPPESTNRGTARTAKKANNKRRRAPDEDVDVPRGKRRRPPPVEHEFLIEGQLVQPYVYDRPQAPDAPNCLPPTQLLSDQPVYDEYGQPYAVRIPYPTSLVAPYPPAAPDQVNNAGFDSSNLLDDLPQQDIPDEFSTDYKPSPRTTTPPPQSRQRRAVQQSVYPGPDRSRHPMTTTTDAATEFDAGIPPPVFTPAVHRPWTGTSAPLLGQICVGGMPADKIVKRPTNLSPEMAYRLSCALWVLLDYFMRFQGKFPPSLVPDPEIRPPPEKEVIAAGDTPDEKDLKEMRNEERDRKWNRARNSDSATKSRRKKAEKLERALKLISVQNAIILYQMIWIITLLAELDRLPADFQPSELFGNCDFVFNKEFGRPVPDEGVSPVVAQLQCTLLALMEGIGAHGDRYEDRLEEKEKENMRDKRQQQKKAVEDLAKNNTNTTATATATTTATAKLPRVRKGKQPTEGQ